VSRCEVLVATCDRAEALGVTLAGLAAQPPPRLVVADQSVTPVADHPVVAAMLRVLERSGTDVEVHHRCRRLGVAEQRAFLLGQARANRVLFLDDDVWLHPWATGVLEEALDELGCGFVGMAVQGLSYYGDRRLDELAPFEPWDGQVRPERVRRGSSAWRRYSLHNAANPAHLAEMSRASPQHWVPYKVAWIGGCVLFRTDALTAVGGFDFWTRLPRHHAGEDVVAQLRVMERDGGAGILPSGAVHLEVPTTLVRRDMQAYDLILGRDSPA
jgi:GT2 family glycosyltransferase